MIKSNNGSKSVIITDLLVKKAANFHLTPILAMSLFNSNLGFFMDRKTAIKNKFLKVRSI